ncbi:unnamed protein product [Mesocestoides corti]|uniref:DDE Tnp4 domain-containing protein n=1 Tax=Mesocestoides corti TaxID=53468 RepID=A0A0R3UHR5_MESCO|nr:unnamed protein product [Mesocestoides corti]
MLEVGPQNTHEGLNKIETPTEKNGAPVPKPRTKPPQRQSLTESENASPRVVMRCLHAPSAYEELVKKLLESSGKQYSRTKRHMDEEWRMERDTYELFYENASVLRNEFLGGSTVKMSDNKGTSTPSTMRSMWNATKKSGKGISGMNMHHRIQWLSSLHISICCEWFGKEPIGIHRWTSGGNEVTLSWQRFFTNLTTINTETLTVESSIETKATPRSSADFFWISGSTHTSFFIPPGLAEIESIEAYFDIFHDPLVDLQNDAAAARFSDAVPHVIKFGQRISDTSDASSHTEGVDQQKEETHGIYIAPDNEYDNLSEYSSSDFDTDISVDEEGEFIVRTEEEKRQARLKAKTGNGEEQQEPRVSIGDEDTLNVSSITLEVGSQNRPTPAKRTRRLTVRRFGHLPRGLNTEGLSRQLINVRYAYDLIPYAKTLRRKYCSDILDQEHPLPVGTLLREVIKRVPQIYPPDGDSPDISTDSGIDESLVEATTEGVLKGCPVMVKTLLRKNGTVIPAHREIFPLIPNINLREDQPIIKASSNVILEKFLFDCNRNKLPRDAARYFLETILPVSSITPEDFDDKELREDDGTSMGLSALLQKLRKAQPEVIPYQSTLNNVSASRLARRQNPYFRQAILHNASRKSRGSKKDCHEWIRPPQVDQTRFAVKPSGIPVRCVFLPPPKNFHFSMITQMEELLDKNHPLLVSMMVRIWQSVRPSNAWVVETDKMTLDYALNRLTLDLLRYRHVAGHCIRFKALSVLHSSHRNRHLRNQMIASAAHPGNWLDQLLRAGLSTYSSCRFEAALCLLGLVTDEDLMGRIYMKGARPLISDIFVSLFLLADMFEDTSTAFFVVMTYMVCHNEHRVLLETILKCGPKAKSQLLIARWPYLVAFAYTYWSRRRLLSFTMRESLLVGILNEAWRNPVSRRAAREAMKGIRDFVESLSPFMTQWPNRQKRTPMVHMN